MITTIKPKQAEERRWLTTGEYVSYLLSERKSCAFLKTEQIQDTLAAIGRQENLKPEDLLQQLSGLFQINELSFNARQLTSLSRLSQVAFLVHDGMLLPAECIQESNIAFGVGDQPRVFFLSATLPNQKLTKKQFVNTLM